MVPAPAGERAEGAPRLHPSQVRCKRGATCKLFQQGVCMYNHDEEKAAGMTPDAPADKGGWGPAKGGGKGKDKGKGKGPQMANAVTDWAGNKVIHYNDLPETATAVTLFGQSGYFIPKSSILPPNS